MEAVRKIATVKNGILSFHDLDKYNNQEVEVIIFPLFYENLKNRESQKKKLLKFKGIFSSEYKDTSIKVDELLYGK
ncbi:MAG: hypothetical protein H8E57_04745 [Candidatus Cloacimonetes bacterium]|nr:hypothetical protein [Candidatus Cloacimonadota bacterium]